MRIYVAALYQMRPQMQIVHKMLIEHGHEPPLETGHD